jgi:thiamine biosynthesis lipoprotein
MELDGRRGRRLRSSYQIEEGGFGKGAALAVGFESALAAGARCVVADFGGQAMVAGRCAPVRIGIADSGRRHDRIASLVIEGGSVATSGNSERGIEIAGVRYGHLLDPGTGLPVEDWGSVAVVAADPLTADCVSTALYVMGPHRGAEWIVEHEGIEAVFVLKTVGPDRIAATDGLMGVLEASDDREIEWLGKHRRTLDVGTTSGLR